MLSLSKCPSIGASSAKASLVRLVPAGAQRITPFSSQGSRIYSRSRPTVTVLAKTKVHIALMQQ